MADLDDQKRLEELARKYLKGIISPAEQLEFDRWFADQAAQPAPSETDLTESKHRDELLNRIHAEAGIRTIHRLWPRIAVAASVILAISAGGYFLLHQSQPAQQVVEIKKQDIEPGRNRATLTLANGQQIVLIKGLNGKLAQQGNATISVNAGQAIAYEATAAKNSTVEYNTLTTVRGEQSPYPLVLADGTKAWLNAASSITFPTAFNGKDRVVKITGEVYFEVAHNEKLPFKVEARGQIIEDIGTTFNVNAYADEPATKTTLISGIIKINNKLLKPGQEGTGDNVQIKNVDTEGATAWKNGYFLFDDESLESILRKVSRWYDVEIIYPNGRKITDGFLGSINRYSKVSQVLALLEETGHVRFKIDGKKIKVTNK